MLYQTFVLEVCSEHFISSDRYHSLSVRQQHLQDHSSAIRHRIVVDGLEDNEDHQTEEKVRLEVPILRVGSRQHLQENHRGA